MTSSQTTAAPSPASRSTTRRVTYQGGECTFRGPHDVFDLDGDPALARLARIAHAADSPRIPHSHPLGPGLLAMGEGRRVVGINDRQRWACLGSTQAPVLAQHAPGRPDARIRPTKRLQLRRLSLMARPPTTTMRV